MSAHGRDDPGATQPRDGARPAGPPDRVARPGSTPRRPAVGVRVVAVAAAATALLLAAVLLAGGVPRGPSPTGTAPLAAGPAGGSPSAPSPSGSLPATPSTASTTGTGSASPLPSASIDGSSPGQPSAAPTAQVADVPLVPVTSFRSGRTSTRISELRAIAAGTSPYASLVLVKADAPAELKALGLDAASLGSRLVRTSSASVLMTTLARHPTWLGFLRADEVGPGVKALAWGTASLFGEQRVASLAAWPLHARLAVDSGATAYDPAKAWTLLAAGDLGLDRGVALSIRTHANNVNFPFNGGTVTITGHCRDCSEFGWDLPYTRRTGNAGAVRSLIRGADLAIANLETLVVKNYTFHDHGTTFTGNPAYLAGLRTAGFDWVSLGNNHIGDAGPSGVLQTISYLDKYGLEHGGAGANTAAAHEPSILTVDGVKVALLSYDTVAPGYNATATRAGSARMTSAWLKHDIRAARDAGAQVVIVWPHWGVEYTTGPSAAQRALAHSAIDAGADLVIGNHPHWAQAMEVYKGRPIWYALGNFTFDQTWSEPTMEGISLELTFSGARLVQAWLHPHLVLDYSQPNLLDPLHSGKAVLDQVFKASKHLPW